MAWTDKMVEELKKMWKQGITTGEIGRRLGISKNSIVGKVHRLGLEGRPSPIKKGSEDESKESCKKTKSDKASKAKTADKKCVKENKPLKEAKPLKEEKVTKSKSKSPVVEDKKVKSSPTALKKVASNKEKLSKVTADQMQLELDIEATKAVLNSEPKQEKVYKENITLTELDNHTCRWPIGDPKDEDFRFCGCKVKTGQTYCEEHSAIAYVKPVRK